MQAKFVLAACEAAPLIYCNLESETRVRSTPRALQLSCIADGSDPTTINFPLQQQAFSMYPPFQCMYNQLRPWSGDPGLHKKQHLRILELFLVNLTNKFQRKLFTHAFRGQRYTPKHHIPPWDLQ